MIDRNRRPGERHSNRGAGKPPLLDRQRRAGKINLMGCKLLTSLLASAACAAAAFAMPPELSSAIDAWLDDDYSEMQVIERHARAGDATALGVQGQACYYGLGCTRDRTRGLDLMRQAADAGDVPSMLQLGRIYENGAAGLPADTALAAKWYRRAAEAGDTLSAPAALARLQPETAPAAVEPPRLEAAAPLMPMTPAAPPAPVQPPAPPPAAPRQPAASAPPAAPVILSDGAAFPVYLTTGLGRRGDVAATCYAELDPIIDPKIDELEALIALSKTQSPVQQVRTASQVDVLNVEVRSLIAVRKMAGETLKGLVGQNGLTEQDVNAAMNQHISGRRLRPETGPGPELCRQRYMILDAELMISDM